ncbi:MAG: hydroxylase [Planctomycetota bacterium]
MKIQYLEIVSPEADSICKTYEDVHGLDFSEPVAVLGNARTADLPDDSTLAVRGPLRSNETPVVRPYFLVEDIDASIAKAAEAGAEIAIPSMEIPGYGTCAIFILGGIEHALWQV